MIWLVQAAHFFISLKGYDWSLALFFENMRAMKVQAWTSMEMAQPDDSARRTALLLGAGSLLALVAGCSSKPPARPTQAAQSSGSSGGGVRAVNPLNLSDDLREGMLARTMLVVNTPYTYGGNSPEGGFDCSGLIQWAVGGVTERRLPRTTSQWAQSSNPVSGRDLLRGDFVFFNTLGGRYSHMGIFVGNGQFVHAPSSGGTVQRVRMDNVYFAKRFTEARSIFA